MEHQDGLGRRKRGGREWLNINSLNASIVVCALSAAMMTTAIISRAFGYLLVFVDEYSSYLMTACALFALRTVTSRREHLLSDFLFTKCNALWQRIGHEGRVDNLGRFVYLHTQGHPDTNVELSDMSGPKGRMFVRIAEAKAKWNGTETIRTVWPIE